MGIGVASQVVPLGTTWLKARTVITYLDATIGTVTTPNPGPLPAQYTFIVKMRPTRSTDTADVIVGQFETEGQMSWIEQWYEGPNYHAFYYSLSPTGSSGATVQRPITNPTDLVNQDALIAISITLDNGSGRNVQSLSRSLDNGATWQPVATSVDTGAAVAPFTSNTAMRIGARTGAVNPFAGRIYSVELRTGLDPAAGTVAWRFDANDYPGTGTVYADPRGRTWTLSSAGCIVPGP